MSTFIFDDTQFSSAGRIPVLHTFLERCSAILQRQFFSWSLLEGLCCSSLLFKIPQRCSVGFKSGDIFGQVIVFTFLLCVILAVCFGSFSCWNYSSFDQLLETGSHLVSQYFGISTGIHGAIYKWYHTNTFWHSCSPISSHSLVCFTVGTMHSQW